MPRNPDKRPCSVPDCRAWAVRGSVLPLCAAHMPDKANGAPPGNRNTLVHGFYASTLHPDDLAILDEEATDSSLDGEILIIRVALRRLQQMVLSGTTPGPNPRRLEASDYARFIGLTFQGANTLARLLRVRYELPDNPWDRIMDAALDNLSEEWGIEL
jgi:hypothetical protein